MNRNGTPAIILIYLMVMLLVFMDRKSHCLADITSTTARTNLYSAYQDRLNATSNLAISEYDSKTTETMGKIYDLVGRILNEQLKQQQEQKANTKETNYADKLVDEADPSRSHDILPPAVALVAANTATDVAKKYSELINAPLSDVNQLNHRQARKIRKESHSFCPRPNRVKKSYYTETSVARKQGSRPRWADRRMRPSLVSLSMPVGGGDSEEWQLSPISTQSETRQSAQSIDDDDKEDAVADWRCKRSRIRNGNIESTAVEDVSRSETNELAEYYGGSESSNQHGLPSDKWRRKLKIDGRIKNLRNCRSWPNLLEKQSNELIENDQEVDEADDKRRRKSRTVTDPFPEIFSQPLVDAPALPVVGATAEITEALKKANNMLAVRSNPPPAAESADAGHRISKQTESFDITSLEGQNPGEPVRHPGGDASLTNVMEKVLDELESLKACKGSNNTQAPEGSPCDVVGTWNSEIIGLQFHFALADPSPSSRSFVEGKKMEVEVTEKIPPRRHDLMDCDWYFTASTIKQFGGPFYVTAQKTDKYIVSTFAGLCKTCGGIPTIFGSWTFVYPAKDCQDVSLAVETKRDVLRKDTLEAKRKHRLSKTSKGKCLSCG